MEKMGVGVKNSGGKNPKYGKNLVVGAKSAGLGKRTIPSWNFFPTPPLGLVQLMQQFLA